MDAIMRKCKECGKNLSQYNKGKYCFAHQAKGSLKELRRQEELERSSEHRKYLSRKKLQNL